MGEGLIMTRGQGVKKIAGLLTGSWGRLDLNVFAHDALLDLLALAGQHDEAGGAAVGPNNNNQGCAS